MCSGGVVKLSGRLTARLPVECTPCAATLQLGVPRTLGTPTLQAINLQMHASPSAHAACIEYRMCAGAVSRFAWQPKAGTALYIAYSCKYVRDVTAHIALAGFLLATPNSRGWLAEGMMTSAHT